LLILSYKTKEKLVKDKEGQNNKWIHIKKL